MACGRPLVTDPVGVGIVELAHICATLRAHSLDLFEVTGGWVSDSDAIDEVRLFAEASHRHAWHAELWAARSPVTPDVDLDRQVSNARRHLDSSPGDDRVDRYIGWLGLLLDRLTEVEQRVAPELDPNTGRTIGLVRNDLLELRER